MTATHNGTGATSARAEHDNEGDTRTIWAVNVAPFVGGVYEFDDEASARQFAEAVNTAFVDQFIAPATVNVGEASA